jgi:hypothetical protein
VSRYIYISSEEKYGSEGVLKTVRFVYILDQPRKFCYSDKCKPINYQKMQKYFSNSTQNRLLYQGGPKVLITPHKSHEFLWRCHLDRQRLSISTIHSTFRSYPPLIVHFTLPSQLVLSDGSSTYVLKVAVWLCTSIPLHIVPTLEEGNNYYQLVWSILSNATRLVNA